MNLIVKYKKMKSKMPKKCISTYGLNNVSISDRKEIKSKQNRMEMIMIEYNETRNKLKEANSRIEKYI